MREFFQSVSSFFKAVANYIGSVWGRALEVLSLRGGEMNASAGMGSAMFAGRMPKEMRPPRHKAFGFRVLNRRLERGRSGTHRHESRNGRP